MNFDKAKISTMMMMISSTSDRKRVEKGHSSIETLI